MQKRLSTAVLLGAVALLGVGCAQTERKLGRGINNVTEFTRMGEIRRSVEQTAVWDNSDAAYAQGFIHGFNRSVGRTLVGAYEIVTCPIPDKPIMTPERPVYPDSYKPNFLSDAITDTDTALGFSGGDIAPMMPGSRFRVFDY